MSSEAKNAANRENARKSTGPKSARGKGKSKLNAVKHGIYATTPVLSWEDHDAYRKLAKANQEHFAPVGPVEDMLVHQINTEQWKLRRIEMAEAALIGQLTDIHFSNFNDTLNAAELEYARNLLLLECPDLPAEKSCEDVVMDEDRKKSIEAGLKRMWRIDTNILAALIPPAERAPLAYLDRERRMTLRACLAYVDKLEEVQDRRKTISLGAHPLTTAKATKLRTAGSANTSVPKSPANQNRSKVRNGS